MPPKTITVQITFDTDDGSFEDIGPDTIHAALCRAFPYLRMSEVSVIEVPTGPLAPKKTKR